MERDALYDDIHYLTTLNELIMKVRKYILDREHNREAELGTAIKLAKSIVDFMYEYDYYGTGNCYDSEEAALEDTFNELMNDADNILDGLLDTMYYVVGGLNIDYEMKGDN